MTDISVNAIMGLQILWKFKLIELDSLCLFSLLFPYHIYQNIKNSIKVTPIKYMNLFWSDLLSMRSAVTWHVLNQSLIKHGRELCILKLFWYQWRGVSTLTLAVWTALHTNEGRPENLEQPPDFVMKLHQKRKKLNDIKNYSWEKRRRRRQKGAPSLLTINPLYLFVRFLRAC